jgi:hypothetical protein
MRYDMLEHAKMKAMRDKHPEWIWNRSDTHVILGVPGTLDAFKTRSSRATAFRPAGHIRRVRLGERGRPIAHARADGYRRP